MTLEDNYGGGLGTAVADVLVEYGGLFTVKQIFVRQIPKSSRTPNDLLRHLGLFSGGYRQNRRRRIGGRVEIARSWERRKILAL